MTPIGDPGAVPLLPSDVFSFVETQRFANALDSVRTDMSEDARFDQTAIGSTIVMSTGLSVGYVIWLVRGGALLSSLLSSLPAWQLIDPLPILARTNRNEDGDDESLESMVEGDSQSSKPERAADDVADRQPEIVGGNAQVAAPRGEAAPTAT